MDKIQYYGTGKRKSSTARVFLTPGTGQVVINNIDYQQYFQGKTQQGIILQPLKITDNLEKFNLYINVAG